MKRRHCEKVLIRIQYIGTPLISGSSGLPVDSFHIESDRPYTIGRSGSNGLCDFVLDHGGVSRKHCQILFDSQSRKLYIFDGVILLSSGGFSQVFVELRSRVLGADEFENENEDLGNLKFRYSLNGIFVNRVRVRKAKIQEISIGDEVLFVCGNEGLCYKHGRCRMIGASVSSGHSRGTFSSGKRSKRVFAPMENEINSPVSGFYPPKAAGVTERLNYLVSYCRHILSSDDPISFLRLSVISDSGKVCLSCCTPKLLRSKASVVADNREVKSAETYHEMGHCFSGLRVRNEQPNPKLHRRRRLGVSDLISETEHEGASCISVSDKSRTILPFDGKKENTPDISCIGKEKSCRGSLQTPGKNFFLNRLQYIEHSSTGCQRVVSLPELLHPVESISKIFIATFTSDILWFLTCCEIPSHLPVTIACHHAERCWRSSPDARTVTPLPTHPNVTVVFPPFPEDIAFGKDRKNHGIGCHHPKLFILKREDSIRVIITSANLVARQWNDVTNTVWWQDFPRRVDTDVLSPFGHCRRETNLGLRSDFSAQLAGFTASLLSDVPSQAHWILEFMKYNFEHSAVLGRYKWPESQESEFIYSASSIGGSASAGFQADFSSAAGKKTLQHDSQESDPEGRTGSSSIKIIFPTIERVKNGHHGVLSSKRLLCFSEKTWQKLRHYNVLHDAVPNPQDRVGHPMHSKVAMRLFTYTRGSRSSSFGWVYCGSHNFSAAAWGQTISRSSRNSQEQSRNGTRLVNKLRVCNYELGIVFVFPPPHGETDSYAGSKIDDIVLPFVVPAPKYGWSDRPATGLAMKEALTELREGSRSICGEIEVEEEVEEDEEEGEDEAGGTGELVAEEEKQEEKAYAEALWSQVESSSLSS